MAQKIVRASDGREVKPASEEKKARKKAEAVEGAVEEAVEKPAKKKEQTVVQAEPVKGSAAGYRAGAIVLWILAIACEILAILALTKNFTIRFTQNGNTNMLILLIGLIVLDFIFAVVAAQLWKKANRIKPMSEKNKFLFYLWSEMGVIMACICFIPLIILLLKSNKLDKKTKTIVTTIAAAALLIAGVASADFHPVSAEQKAEAESTITDDVYWTTFGHKYHLDLDCQAIVNSNTVYQGTVTEAIESGRTAICSFCAKRHADELDLDALNVEKEIGEEASVAPAA